MSCLDDLKDFYGFYAFYDFYGFNDFLLRSNTFQLLCFFFLTPDTRHLTP